MPEGQEPTALIAGTKVGRRSRERGRAWRLTRTQHRAHRSQPARPAHRRRRPRTRKPHRPAPRLGQPSHPAPRRLPCRDHPPTTAAHQQAANPGEAL